MLLSLCAAAAALLTPLAAQSQLAKEKPPASTTEPVFKYQAYVGWGYTSTNQINQSNNGLQGVTLSVTRNWGRFFGLTVQGGHYAWTITRANPTNPTMDYYLAGPEIHAPLYGPTSLFVHGLLGAAHTGGVSIQPDESFAGGAGIGMDYKLNPRFSVRLQGDDIGSSFTVQPYEAGDSPHRRFNAHATIGVVYNF